MNKFDMHFHSTLSDGKSSTEEILKRADKLGMEMMTLTDHDRISTEDFIQKAATLGIKSYHSTEISTKNYQHGKSLHLTCYAQKFGDEIHQILDNTISGKIEMLSTQIDIFIEKGFSINKGDFYNSCTKVGKTIGTLNKFNLAQFMYEDVENIKKVTHKIGKEVDVEGFYLEFLKDGGQFYEEYHKQIPDYEPSVGIVGTLAKKDNAILSIAHPNFTFAREHISGFKEKLPYYLDRGVNAIEINSKASKKWIEAIYEVKDKYGLLLTLGSDNHGIGMIDRKHEDFGTLNSLLSIEDREQIGKEILEYLG